MDDPASIMSEGHLLIVVQADDVKPQPHNFYWLSHALNYGGALSEPFPG